MSGAREMADGAALAEDGFEAGLTVRVAALCSAVAFLDGFDSTSISIAAPLISQQLALVPAQLGLVFSSALLGAAIGAVAFGRLADRFGRKRMLVISTLIFGLFTLGTAFATSLGGLLALRFLAGLGLGGASPCFIALASEFAPAGQRERVTSFIWTAFALGTVIGTFISAYLVSVSGWQAIFLVGGVAPLIVLCALLVWLPESRRFLRLRAGLTAEGGAVVERPGRGDAAGGPRLRGLLGGGSAPSTLLLWFAFWTAFGTMVAVFSYAPTIMREHGIPLSRAAVVLGMAGIGSLLGSAAAGLLIERIGPTVVLATAFVLGAVATACLGYAPGSVVTTGVIMAAIGLLVGGVCGAGLIAFASVIYPTAMRSTGVGSAMSAARVGQVSMPLAISLMLRAGFDYGDAFVVLSGVLAVAALAVVLLQRRRQDFLQLDLRPHLPHS